MGWGPGFLLRKEKFRGKAIDAFGEFPLLGLSRFAGFVGIAAEEDEVYPVFQRIVNDLVKSGQEIDEA